MIIDTFSGQFGNEILIANMRVQIDAPVLTWHDHGLTFKAGHGARRRHEKQRIDLCVLHWTGAESTARQTFRVLSGRSLGVEFLIDRQGIVWQFADPALIDTFDAGPVNRRSVGVEITNYGFRRPNQKVPLFGQDRPLYTTQLNGRQRSFAAFYPCQLQSAIALCDGIRGPLRHIEKAIPRNGTNRFIQRVLKKRELDSFAGVLGHFHVSERKADPGTEIFEALDLEGYA